MTILPYISIGRLILTGINDPNPCGIHDPRPKGEGCGLKPTVPWFKTHGLARCMKGTRVGWFSTYSRSAHPTFLNVQNFYFQDIFVSLHIKQTIQTITLTIHPLPFTQMPPKRKPVPLHVSWACTASKKNAGIWRRSVRNFELLNYIWKKIAMEILKRCVS